MAIFTPTTVISIGGIVHLGSTTSQFSPLSSVNDGNQTTAATGSYSVPFATGGITPDTFPGLRVSGWSGIPAGVPRALGIVWQIQSGGTSPDRNGKLIYNLNNATTPLKTATLISDSGASSAFGPSTGNINILGTTKIPLSMFDPGSSFSVDIETFTGPNTQAGSTSVVVSIFEVWIETLVAGGDVVITFI